jgi:hypothetical protein
MISGRGKATAEFAKSLQRVFSSYALKISFSEGSGYNGLPFDVGKRNSAVSANSAVAFPSSATDA